MALTYTTNWAFTAGDASSAITSGTLSASVGDYITVAVITEDNPAATAFTISNNNTAVTWGTAKITTNTASNCKVVMWAAVVPSGTTLTTITVTATAGSYLTCAKSLATAIHTGAHATDPLPSGNLFSGVGATDVSQSITPTSAGSALWMVGGDWNQTNSYAARTNCTLVATRDDAGRYTSTFIRPTTQPRTDTSAFALGETDTSGKIAWAAWEVQAAAASGSTGTLAYTNINDTSAASGTTTVTGSLAKTNANDTSAASGTTTVTGTLAKTNANDTVAASGTTTVKGALATTNANDTCSASGSVGSPVSGTLAYTNINDSIAASGTTAILGTLAYTNANDTSSASGTTTIKGSLATTNANDTCVASGSSGNAVFGTLAYTNANDTSVATGTTTVTGTLARTNANDTSAASGTTTVIGNVAYTNIDDICSASGIAGIVSGTVSYTNENDTCVASGIVTHAEEEILGGGGFGFWADRTPKKPTKKEKKKIAEILEEAEELVLDSQFNRLTNKKLDKYTSMLVSVEEILTTRQKQRVQYIQQQQQKRKYRIYASAALLT